MARLSRRNAVLGVCGALASGVAAQAWFDSGPTRTGPPTRGRGAPTAFGSVAVLGSSRRTRTLDGGTAHLHGDHHPERPAAAAALPGLWSDTVRVEVEVHNGLNRPLLFSPGQFRLRVGTNGPSVTPYDAERPPGSLPAGRTLTTWVSYLTPGEADELGIEFTEADTSEVLRIAVNPTAEVSS